MLSLFESSDKPPSILCACDTNVAVDNMLENLTDIGVRALRVGQTVKIREDLRNLSLDYATQNHKFGKILSQIRFDLSQCVKNGGKGIKYKNHLNIRNY